MRRGAARDVVVPQNLRHDVVVKRAAGEHASYSDAYAGWRQRGDPLDADIVLGLNPPPLAHRYRGKPAPR